MKAAIVIRRECRRNEVNKMAAVGEPARRVVRTEPETPVYRPEPKREPAKAPDEREPEKVP
jgi:hypothetical protein